MQFHLPDLDFFLARRARRGFLDSDIFLILAGSSCTLMVARACDISSCERGSMSQTSMERYMYLHAKRLFRVVYATCMQGSVTVCVHLPASLSVSLSIFTNLLNLND